MPMAQQKAELEEKGGLWDTRSGQGQAKVGDRRVGKTGGAEYHTKKLFLYFFSSY